MVGWLTPYSITIPMRRIPANCAQPAIDVSSPSAHLFHVSLPGFAPRNLSGAAAVSSMPANRFDGALDDVDDSQLVGAVLTGDARAELAFYDRHVDRIYRLACRMTGDETLARGLTQDTFIRVFGKLPDFRRESASGTWLHCIAVSVTLNGIKKVKRIHAREHTGEELPEVAITTRRSEPDLRPVSPPVVEYPPRALRGTVIIRGDIVKPTLDDHEIDLERDHV